MSVLLTDELYEKFNSINFLEKFDVNENLKLTKLLFSEHDLEKARTNFIYIRRELSKDEIMAILTYAEPSFISCMIGKELENIKLTPKQLATLAINNPHFLKYLNKKQISDKQRLDLARINPIMFKYIDSPKLLDFKDIVMMFKNNFEAYKICEQQFSGVEPLEVVFQELALEFSLLTIYQFPEKLTKQAEKTLVQKLIALKKLGKELEYTDIYYLNEIAKKYNI